MKPRRAILPALLLGLCALAAIVLMFHAATSQDEPADTTLRLGAVSLLEVTPVQLAYGDSVAVEGVVHTRFDGTTFDAATHLANDQLLSGGLIDAEAGGLHLARRRLDEHSYAYTATGQRGPGCIEAGVGSPCLVPRTAALAHERLLSLADFVQTLDGGLESRSTPPPLVTPRAVNAIKLASLAFGVTLGAGLVVVTARARRRSPLGRVRAAAREAERQLRRDSSLASLSAQVGPLVARAEHLEEARRACEDKRRRIDRAALERRRAVWAAASAASAGDALEWIDAERREAERLDADHAASLAGLERIISALRVLSLASRKHRGFPSASRARDPVDEVADELALRDAAEAEVEALRG